MNMFGKIVAACAFACAMFVARADFVVVDNGRPVAVVCVGGNASSAAQFAAKEIAKYVEAMTGAKLKVVVGRTVGGARIEIDDAAKGLEREEFRIETKSGVLSLSGGSPRAALYAAYELLEHFGCGFWSPFNETVPSAKSLSVEGAVKAGYSVAAGAQPVRLQDTVETKAQDQRADVDRCDARESRRVRFDGDGAVPRRT